MWQLEIVFVEVCRVLLRLLSFAKFFDSPSYVSRMFEVVSVLGRSFTSLASVINIVHVFVCGEAANVNLETQALTSAKFSGYVENIFYLYLKYLLFVILYVNNKH